MCRSSFVQLNLSTYLRSHTQHTVASCETVGSATTASRQVRGARGPPPDLRPAALPRVSRGLSATRLGRCLDVYIILPLYVHVAAGGPFS